MDGFDFEKPLDHDDNKLLYEPWDTSVDFYEFVKMYYEGDTEVRCLTKDDCNSDEEYVGVDVGKREVWTQMQGLLHRIWKANASLPAPLWTCKPTNGIRAAGGLSVVINQLNTCLACTLLHRNMPLEYVGSCTYILNSMYVLIQFTVPQ